jgi:carbamate kinase
LVTQVRVDENDPAFNAPTKPIGPFYTKEEADVIAKEKGYVMKEDAGRGFRRVVASPIPQEIVELDSLLKLYDSTVVITAGGGGIPVIEKNGSYEGVAAVIDKDYAAEKVAEDINADVLMILTEVETAFINYGKTDQKELRNIDVSEAKKHMEDGQFAAGSMLPKINAAMKFAGSKLGRKAIITSLYKATEALDGKTGTIIG